MPRPLSPAEALALMQTPERWPLRVVLALSHASKRDPRSGLPELGFLAIGHGPKVYLGELGEFRPGETRERARFETALERFRAVTFISYAAVLQHGWRVD